MKYATHRLPTSMKNDLIARICFISGLLLTLPAGCYILSVLLAFSCHAGFLYDMFYGIVKELGLRRWISYNMNAIMIYAPLFAFLSNLFLMIKINKRPMNLSILIFSGLILLFWLFIFLKWEL